MWKEIKIKLNYPERLIAFSVSNNNKLLLIDCDWVAIVNLDKELIEKEIIKEDKEFIIEQYLRLKDKAVIKVGGEEFCNLIGQASENSINEYGDEKIKIEKKQDGFVKIFITISKKTDLIYEYKDLSGDWNLTTFSPNGQYIIIGNPYDLAILKRE